MPISINSAMRRIEFTLGGRLVFVVPLSGGSVDDVDPDQVFVGPPEITAKAEAWLSGDEAAGDELEQQFDVANQVLEQREAQRAQTKRSGQIVQNARSGTGEGQQEGLLPAPQMLAAQVDTLSDALDLNDAITKQNMKIDALQREAQRRGRPIDIRGMIGQPQAGVTGKLGPISAISEAAATDPDYLRIFGGINNLAGVTEIRRIDNILAGVADELEQADREQQVHDRVSAYQRDLDDMDFERQEMTLDPTAGGEEGRVKMEQFERRYQRNYARIKEAQEREIEKVRPGYGAFQQAGDQFAIDQLPEGQRHMYNAASARFTPGMKIQLQPTDRTDPNNPDQKQPTIPTVAMFGQTAPQAQPLVQPQVQPQADQPPGPPPDGFKWVKEGTQWVLKDIDEYEMQAQGAGMFGSSGGAGFQGGAPLAMFAGGGMFESPGYAAQPSPNAFNASPMAQPTPQGFGAVPTNAYQRPYTLPGFGPDQLDYRQTQEYQQAIEGINEAVEEQKQLLVEDHRIRMAELVAGKGQPRAGAPAIIPGAATYPGQATSVQVPV